MALPPCYACLMTFGPCFWISFPGPGGPAGRGHRGIEREGAAVDPLAFCNRGGTVFVTPCVLNCSVTMWRRCSTQWKATHAKRNKTSKRSTRRRLRPDPTSLPQLSVERPTASRQPPPPSRLSHTRLPPNRRIAQNLLPVNREDWAQAAANSLQPKATQHTTEGGSRLPRHPFMNAGLCLC